MTSHFIISLDLELMWGVRDHRTVDNYGDAILGVRDSLPKMLSAFETHGVRATWATVGMLFARDRDELIDHAPPPELQPQYDNMVLSPYPFLTGGLGKNEEDDPWHFGRSLVDRVADTEGQEIATHTFSHYYCLEPGETVETFSADMKAACSIATEAGHTLKSIVFPRNQTNPDHILAAANEGVTIYRGNPDHFAYRSRAGSENTLMVRGVRLIDGAFPLVNDLGFTEPDSIDGAENVPASRFLRPYMNRVPVYSHYHIERVCREMEAAARAGQSYHLWWHPHNMGRNQDENLAQLDRVIETFVQLRDTYGMTSSTMLDMSQSSASLN